MIYISDDEYRQMDANHERSEREKLEDRIEKLEKRFSNLERVLHERLCKNDR